MILSKLYGHGWAFTAQYTKFRLCWQVYTYGVSWLPRGTADVPGKPWSALPALALQSPGHHSGTSESWARVPWEMHHFYSVSSQ